VKKDLVVSVIQVNAQNDLEENLLKSYQLLSSVDASCDLIVFPEAFLMRGNAQEQLSAVFDDSNEVIKSFSSWAQERNSWLVSGTVNEREGKRVYSTSYLFNPQGEVKAKYRKIHLFHARLKDRVIDERMIYSSGSKPITVEIEGWVFGFGICYDLRFPELFRYYATQGVDAILLPSNFTYETGKAHWETLCRARAIENQCYFIAPNQSGCCKSTGIKSYGHSLAFDPWGKPLFLADEKEGVYTATLEEEVLKKTRSKLSCLKHKKKQFYI
jgi:deaminated glutathione amidase